MNCHRNQETKTRNSNWLCQSLRKVEEKCSMWFTKCVGDISLYLKGSVYYIDLPCVATIHLLLVIELRDICMGFFKKGVFNSFLNMADMILALELMSMV